MERAAGNIPVIQAWEGDILAMSYARPWNLSCQYLKTTMHQYITFHV